MYKTVMVYDVQEYIDMEGRRMRHIGYFLSKKLAERAAKGKGPSGMGEIIGTQIITEGPMKGVRLQDINNLQRLSIDKMVREATLREDLMSRLTDEEIRILRQ